MPSAMRIGSVMSGIPGGIPLEERRDATSSAPQTARQKQNKADQQKRDQRQPAWPDLGQSFGDDRVECRANQCASRRSDPADQRYDKEALAHFEFDITRRHEAQKDDMEAAGEPGDRPRKRGGCRFITGNRITDRLAPRLILTDSREHASERRGYDPLNNPENQEERTSHKSVHPPRN